ncbi:hypothetical protein D3C87_354970 [compost metagenome]
MFVNLYICIYKYINNLLTCSELCLFEGKLRSIAVGLRRDDRGELPESAGDPFRMT